MSRNKGQLPEGRSKERFVSIKDWELKCPAYEALSCTARSLLIEFRYRYYGKNNGSIPFSSRDMAERLGVNTDTAMKARRELEAKGWIRQTHGASFDTRKTGLASEWAILNEPIFPAKSPEKLYMEWKKADDNFEVSDGRSSAQKQRANKIQYEKIGPSGPKNSDPKKMTVREIKTTGPKNSDPKTRNAPDLGPNFSDTYRLPGGPGENGGFLDSKTCSSLPSMPWVSRS